MANLSGPSLMVIGPSFCKQFNVAPLDNCFPVIICPLFVILWVIIWCWSTCWEIFARMHLWSRLLSHCIHFFVGIPLGNLSIRVTRIPPRGGWNPTIKNDPLHNGKVPSHSTCVWSCLLHHLMHICHRQTTGHPESKSDQDTSGGGGGGGGGPNHKKTTPTQNGKVPIHIRMGCLALQILEHTHILVCWGRTCFQKTSCIGIFIALEWNILIWFTLLEYPPVFLQLLIITYMHLRDMSIR